MTTGVKRTLCKSDKLRLKSEFEQVRRDGRKYPGSAVVAVVAPAPDGVLKCAVICGKKYSLLSVTRNRARRLLYESFRLLKPDLPPTVRIILIPRRRLMDWKRQQATRELAKLFANAGILPREVAASPPEC